MDPIAICSCWQTRIDQLDEYYRQGNEEEFYRTWESLVQASAEETIDQSLSLLVHFKLRVHFAVYHLTSDADPQTKSHSMGRLTSFLQENGTKYSKFPELAPYFAIPYIRDNADHPLLADIRKPDWINVLGKEMKELLCCTLQSNHNQEIVAEKVCKQRKRYLQLKERYMKLREDHKLLLDLATRLVTALENSLSGETKCAMETLKNYNEEVEKISESLDTAGGVFQWEARPRAISASTETINSEHEAEKLSMVVIEPGPPPGRLEELDPDDFIDPTDLTEHIEESVESITPTNEEDV